MTSRGHGGAAGEDPFANLNLDESWAHSAPVQEQSAAQRDWAVKRARWEAEDRRATEANRMWERQHRKAQVRRTWRKALPWVALLAVGAGMFVADRTFGFGTPGTPLGSPAVDRSAMPPPGVGEQADRILPAVTPRNKGTDFVVAETNPDGSPVMFSPCRAWPVVVNQLNAPPGGYAAVADAVQEVSARTGLQLVVEGVTTEQAADDRQAYQPDRYGKRWAPILVAWTTGGAEKGFAGHGGPTAITLPDTGETHYVSGQVTLDAAGQFNIDPQSLQAVLLHEFGHVVGLKHAASARELMAPVNGAQTRFGPGDRAGLALLGAGRCTDQV